MVRFNIDVSGKKTRGRFPAQENIFVMFHHNLWILRPFQGIWVWSGWSPY